MIVYLANILQKRDKEWR